MKFHIVRNNETLEDILFLYNVTKEELMEQNQHIRSWNKIVPGTKLKIPPITEAVEQDISDMEPFVEDYYPKLNYKEYTVTADEDIPLEASTAQGVADKQPESDSEKSKKDTAEVAVKIDETAKPGYPRNCLKKRKPKRKWPNTFKSSGILILTDITVTRKLFPIRLFITRIIKRKSPGDWAFFI